MSFMRSIRLGALALTVGMVLLCNNTENGLGQADAQRVADDEFVDPRNFGSIGPANQMADYAPFASGGGGFPGAGLGPLARARRQISTPQGGYLQQAQQQQPSSGSQIMSYLSELGPQLQQASAISSLFSSQQQPSSLNGSPAGGGAGSGVNPGQLLGQLSELIRATQDRNARAIESTQQAGLQAGQQASDAARSAQGGIQAALAEMGSGLQRLAANNPNLVPDVKSLYQSVSSKLSSASASVGQSVNPNSSPIQSLPIPQQ